MKNRENDVRIVRRTLADGSTKEYRYGPRQRPEPALHEQTIAKAIAAWQLSAEWRKLHPNTRDNYVFHIDPFFKGMRQTEITQVTRGHLLQMRDDIAAERGDGAALNFVRAVSSFFSWALDREMIEASPALRLARALNRGHLPAWREEQAQRAMRDLPEPYRRVVVLARGTGQRRGDLLQMRWSDYDGEVIRLTQEKTEERLEIPVGPELKAELEAWKTDRTTLTILAFRGKPWDPNYLSTHLPNQLERIGLPRLGVHGLRRLTAVLLAEAGCSTHEIAAITGHRTLQMVQEYTRGVRQRNLATAAVLRFVSGKIQKAE